MKLDKGFFIELVQANSAMTEAIERINRRFSCLRLISFLLFVFFLIFSFVKHFNLILIAVSVVFLAIFVYLCRIHGKSKEQLDYHIVLKNVCERYIARFEGDFSKLPDKGMEFFDKDHPYALDLDVFGDVSLFALYNISHTAFGRERFASNLLGENLPLDLPSVQKAVKELSERIDLIMNFEATSIQGNIIKAPTALSNLYKSDKKVSKSHKSLVAITSCLWLIPLVTLVVATKYVSAAILFVAIVNLLIWFLVSSRYAEIFKSLDGVIRQSESYYRLFELLEEEPFENEMLKNLVKGGAKDGNMASSGLKVLSKACMYASFRAQPLFALLLNMVFAYDIFCADKLLSWSQKYGEELEESLNCLSKIECLMCSAVPGIISKESCFPTIVEGAFFDGSNITHPLLNPEKAVSNSIKLDKELALITGSNMSGKTTLIRTVGICSLLSYMGAFVPATSLTVGKMRIVSSMRIVDSIEEQMSTFRAELVKIGRIVEASKAETTPMLFLIDEIFRGTNSQDRTDGALAVLKNLDKSYITGLMTTHDYALCDKVQESISSVVYYHFSEEYNNNEIIFDYKLHDGVSHQSNAKFLMKLVGIDS